MAEDVRAPSATGMTSVFGNAETAETAENVIRNLPLSSSGPARPGVGPGGFHGDENASDLDGDGEDNYGDDDVASLSSSDEAQPSAEDSEATSSSP